MKTFVHNSTLFLLLQCCWPWMPALPYKYNTEAWKSLNVHCYRFTSIQGAEKSLLLNMIWGQNRNPTSQPYLLLFNISEQNVREECRDLWNLNHSHPPVVLQRSINGGAHVVTKAIRCAFIPARSTTAQLDCVPRHIFQKDFQVHAGTKSLAHHSDLGFQNIDPFLLCLLSTHWSLGAIVDCLDSRCSSESVHHFQLLRWFQVCSDKHKVTGPQGAEGKVRLEERQESCPSSDPRIGSCSIEESFDKESAIELRRYFLLRTSKEVCNLRYKLTQKGGDLPCDSLRSDD